MVCYTTIGTQTGFNLHYTRRDGETHRGNWLRLGYVKRFCLITSACHLPLEEPEATKQSGKEFEQGEKRQMGFPSPCWSAASQAPPDLQGKESFESDGRSFGFRLHWTFEDLKIIIFISILFLFCFKSTLKCCGRFLGNHPKLA